MKKKRSIIFLIVLALSVITILYNLTYKGNKDIIAMLNKNIFDSYMNEKLLAYELKNNLINIHYGVAMSDMFNNYLHSLSKVKGEKISLNSKAFKSYYSSFSTIIESVDELTELSKTPKISNIDLERTRGRLTTPLGAGITHKLEKNLEISVDKSTINKMLPHSKKLATQYRKIWDDLITYPDYRYMLIDALDDKITMLSETDYYKIIFEYHGRKLSKIIPNDMLSKELNPKEYYRVKSLYTIFNKEAQENNRSTLSEIESHYTWIEYLKLWKQNSKKALIKFHRYKTKLLKK